MKKTLVLVVPIGLDKSLFPWGVQLINDYFKLYANSVDVHIVDFNQNNKLIDLYEKNLKAITLFEKLLRKSQNKKSIKINNSLSESDIFHILAWKGSTVLEYIDTEVIQNKSLFLEYWKPILERLKTEFLEITSKVISKFLAPNRNTIIGLSIYNYCLHGSICLARLIKNNWSDSRILFGGCGIDEFFAKEMAAKLDWIKGVVTGPGEQILVDIFNALDKNIEPDELKLIGLFNKNSIQNKKIQNFSQISHKSNIKTMPILFEKDNNGVFHALTQIGCGWGKCTFCSYLDNKLRICFNNEIDDQIRKQFHDGYKTESTEFVNNFAYLFLQDFKSNDFIGNTEEKKRKKVEQLVNSICEYLNIRKGNKTDSYSDLINELNVILHESPLWEIIFKNDTKKFGDEFNNLIEIINPLLIQHLKKPFYQLSVDELIEFEKICQSDHVFKKIADIFLRLKRITLEVIFHDLTPLLKINYIQIGAHRTTLQSLKSLTKSFNNIKQPGHCFLMLFWMRVSDINDDFIRFLKSLKDSRVKWSIALGIESLNPSTLDDMAKGVSPLDIIEKMKIIGDNGGLYGGNYFLSFPTQSLYNVKQEVRFVKNSMHLLSSSYSFIGPNIGLAVDSRTHIYQNLEKYNLKLKKTKINDYWLKKIFNLELPARTELWYNFNLLKLDLPFSIFNIIPKIYYSLLASFSNDSHLTLVNDEHIEYSTAYRIKMFFLAIINKSKGLMLKVFYLVTLLILGIIIGNNSFIKRSILFVKLFNPRRNQVPPHYYINNDQLIKISINLLGKKKEITFELKKVEKNVLRYLYRTRSLKDTYNYFDNLSINDIDSVLSKFTSIGAILTYKDKIVSVVNDPSLEH